MALSRSSVPELPLFTNIASDLPVYETSSTGINSSSLATDVGSYYNRHSRHNKKTKKVN